MAKLFQRLLAGVLASAAITGGTAAYVEAQPGGVYHARLPGLEAFAEKVPDAVRFDLMISRVNGSATAESAGGALPGLSEHCAPALVVGHNALEFGVKLGAVVEMAQMGQLVRDDVVYGLVGVEHQPP